MRSKLIIYDSNCKVCTGLRDLMFTIGLITLDECKAYIDLDPINRQKIKPERFKNEMALIDLNNQVTLYGSNGIAYIFMSKIPWLKHLFRSKLFFSLFTFLYRIIAYNRYIIATPRKSQIACDCYPDSIQLFRTAYIVITYGIAFILTALFGVSVNHILQVDNMTAAIYMLLMAGTGWVLQIIISYFFIPFKTYLEYLGHLGSIMVVGLLVLIPSMILNIFPITLPVWIPLTSVLCSSCLMLWLHISRAKYLELPHYITLLWFLSLQFTAFTWLLILY